MSNDGLYTSSMNALHILTGSLFNATPAATILPAEVPATTFKFFSCPFLFKTCIAPSPLIDFAPPPATTIASG
ncbi:hypothetical protein NY2A_b228R [Paramecium bursaria Chlorella virus NY2A]|uniref:Uncharacterized protein b228R n=1 Tax=Paramecium bursaria Chlorella virus NY2A TaxID=46021 RepID=A7IWA3_PBCVN|nr:hypothetical protein NY2A_b228R [Paramecium bursaria Chlorella virus NY2A]YP_001498292.1 hypothetical protein AR158_C210R [Paramecium bursaria Chlorella virus AR158]ABT14627.1 hypothetical protein NY2A_b228R [Paramecium bursaria Chlorella virus NY2A]ABU43756.1 hypothetical protein AR158_C210R [Paramecium bursaria Chlorella virus AR158]